MVLKFSRGIIQTDAAEKGLNYMLKYVLWQNNNSVADHLF
jgi:hypothetical protein